MTLERELTDYLHDILDAIEKIEQFTAGMTYEQFAGDDKTGFAVVRALEIIGEAAKQVPEGIRTRHPAIPWREMAGTRDKLIHAYFGVNAKVVWKTVQQDLPSVKPLIAQMVHEVADQQESNRDSD
jgi:uncharacterized protein with HEPN domain